MRHPDADPADISEALGLEPEGTWKAGEERRTAKGEPLEGTYAQSYWYCPIASGDDGELAKAIQGALSVLEAREATLKMLRAGGGEFEFFIGWFAAGRNTGEVFAPELLGRLARLGIGLSLDLY